MGDVVCKHERKLRLVLIVGLLAAGGIGWAKSSAAEWPGLWGPARNACVAASLKIAAGADLEEIWRRPVGRGYSEVPVVGDRGYVTFSDGEIDQLAAIELATGKEVWRAPLEVTHRGHDGSGDGPISTPVVDDGRIFTLEPHGRLFAHEAATGEPQWHRDLVADFGAEPPFYGYGTTPLAIDGKLVVLTGATERANVVALDSASGETLWTSHPATGSGYASPVATTLHGVTQIVANTGDRIFSLAPEDGSVLWSVPGVGDPLQGPLPLPENRILVISWNESVVFEVALAGKTWSVREVWRKPVLKSTYSPAVYRDGYLYGMNRTYLTCLDAATGELRWRHKVYDASVILVGDQVAVLGTRSGNFHLVEATPDEFRETLRVQVFSPGARSMTGPVFVDGRFLLRNGEEMVMLKLVAGRKEETRKEGKS